MMMRIFHRNGSILTGSDLGEALLRYSNALAVRLQSDTIDMPIVDTRGRIAHARIEVGYGNPVVGAPARTSEAELVDPDRIEMLYRRANDVTPTATPSPSAD